MKITDWECKDINLHGFRQSDANESREYRRMRYEELMGLLRLPYHSAAQVMRIGALRGIRQRDNYVAHEEAMAWRDGKLNF